MDLMLYPLFVASADVSIVRYFKEKAANIEFAEMLFQAHFNHVICMSLIMILVMTIYNQFSEIFTFWETFLLSLSVSVASLYNVRLRVILFELSFLKASLLGILPNLILLTVSLSLLAYGILIWQERIILPIFGFLLGIVFSGYYSFSSLSKVSRKHFQFLFNAAQWLTPQMIFNALYIYGDRIVAAHYLNARFYIFVYCCSICTYSHSSIGYLILCGKLKF